MMLTLQGCVRPENVGALRDPAPPAVQWQGGDAAALREWPFIIYDVSGDGARLTVSNERLTLLSNELPAEALIKAQLERGAMSKYPLHLVSYEQSRDIATVNLTGDIDAADPQERFAFSRALARTVTGGMGVRYVNVLMDSSALSLGGLPQGALSSPPVDLASEFYWMQTALFTRRAEAQPAAYNAAVYFPAPEKGYLLPEMHALEMRPAADPSGDADSFIRPLLNELMQGPKAPAGYAALMPSETQVLDARIDTFPDGERNVSLNLSGEAREYVERGYISERQLAGAIVLTLTTFIPGVTAISIEIDGHQMHTLDTEFLPSGWMRRNQFADLVAGVVTLYLPDPDAGKLVSVERVVTPEEAASARACLLELFMDDASADAGAPRRILPYIEDADILGVVPVGDTLYVNLSAAACDAFATIPPRDAPLCIYAIVNTLVDFSHINRVQFMREGALTERLCGDIYTASPLMKRL